MLREFFGWWCGQLLELVPARWRWLGKPAGDAIIITPTDHLVRGVHRVTVSLRRNRGETPLGQFAIDAAELNELPGDAARSAVLRLPEADVLAKTITLPLATEGDLRQVLGFEMDRETPFVAEELYWSHRLLARDRKNGRLAVRLLLLPRASLAELVGALGKVGIAPRQVEIFGGPDHGCNLPLDGGIGRSRRWPDRLATPAALALVALVLLVFAMPFIRQAVALAAIDAEIAAARPVTAEAETLHQEIARLTGTIDLVETERDEAGRPLEVIAAATGVLLDDTYLTEIALRQAKVTLTGRSSAAARLIAALAADEVFKNPAFAAPVTRLEAGRSELFTINAEVGP